MAVISDRKRKIIKRRYGKKTASELAGELNLSEKDIRRAAKKMGLESLAETEEVDERRIFIPGKHSIEWTIAAGLLAIIISCTCFGKTLQYPFVFDDHHSIYQNRNIRYQKKDIRDNSNDSSIFIQFFVDPQTFSNQPKRRMFRPLVLTSYATNYILSGYDDENQIQIGYDNENQTGDLPSNWRIFNIMVHAANGFLVFLILDLLLGYRPVSLLLAAIFVVHPAAVEPVVYLSSRSTLMAGTFLFGAIYCFFRRSRKDGRWPWAVGTAVLYFLGLLCKENVFMLPAVLIVAEFLMYSIDDFFYGDRLEIHIPLWVIAVFYLYFRRFEIDLPTAVFSRPDRTISVQVLTQAGVWLDYLGKMLWPIGLNNQPSVVPATRFWISGRSFFNQPAVWFSILTGIGGLVVLLRKNRRLLWGVAFSAIILLPETLITMNQLSNERRMYFPMFGMLVVVGSAISSERLRVGISRFMVPGMLAAIVIMMIPVNMARAGEWQDERTLWFHSIRRAPHSTTSWHGLGYVYGQDAQRAEEKGDKKRGLHYYNKGLWALDKALTINRNYTLSLRLKGAILLTLNRPKEALQYLERAVRREPLSHRGWYNLGLALFRVGRREDAEKSYKKSIALNKFYVLPHNNLAAIYIQRARKKLKEEDITGALKLFEEGRKELNIAQGIEPANREINVKLAKVEDQIKRIREYQRRPRPRPEGPTPTPP